MSATVVDNTTDNRYELRRDGELISFADYRLDSDTVVVTHVETIREHRDQGNSDRLMAGLLDDIAATGRRIRPVCWVAVDYLRIHPTHHELLA